jgi:RNA polymerase sigma-70 factor, ECF subfamily
VRPSAIATSDGINGNEDAATRDMELVVAARAGSSAAFGELQSLYSRRLYNRIFSMTRNREDAEDALQDTFLRAYIALDSFEGRSQFASWLTRIAINSALMTLRKGRRRAETSFNLPSDSEEHSQTFDVCDPALNPEQVYEQRQKCYGVLRAVHRLHPRLRTALSIWMKHEYSVIEVARTLHLSVAAVKTRLYRARKRLNSATGVTEPKRNSGSLSEASRRHPPRRFQNRERPCLRCD